MAMDPKERLQTIITLNNSTVSAGRDMIFGNVYNQDSTPINHALVRQRLQKSLRIRYEHYTHLERLFDNTRIPIADSFINLALIKEIEYKQKEQNLAHGRIEEKDEVEGRERSHDYVDERMASHEQLYAVKEPLAFTELFEPKDDTRTQNKILILGRAGIGKSVLCQYLATQWASDTASFDANNGADAKDEELQEISISHYLQQKFDAVFWLKLREVASKTTERDTLLDVIDRFCLEGLKKDKPTQVELASYLEAYTDRVLFILDGYDEITDRIEQPGYNHLNRILADITSQQHILLTSRPIMIDTLGDHPIQFDRRLENMGFLNENIEAYVHQFMGTAQKLEQAVLMLDFLKMHPGVWGIAHIPINLELLSWLWSKGKLTFEKGEIVTLSKLYQTIVDQVQKSYIQKTSKRPAALALDSLMESKKEIVENTVINCVNEFLEYLAYRAMETETLFISSSEIRIALEKTLVSPECINDEYRQEQLLKSATDKLGFLRAAGQCDKSQLDQEHYFIHLSFQEFYAAKYIARMLSQHPHSEEGEQIFQRILTEKYTPRYQLMLWMSAGLLYQKGKKSQPQKFSSLLRFWRTILSQPRDMIGFHHNVLVMHCLNECEADDCVVLHKALIEQQKKVFAFYAVKYDKDTYNPYIKQLAQCSFLLASLSMMAYLLQILGENEDSIRFAAVEALGRIKNPSEAIIKILLGALEDRNESISCAATEALGKLKNPSETVIAALLNALHAWSENLHYGVCKALGKLKHPSEAVIESLLSILRDHDREEVKSVAAQALIKLGNLSNAVIKKLLSALRGENYIKRVVAEILGELKHPSEAVIEGLLSALRDENGDRCAAAEALGKLKYSSKVVIEALLTALRDEDEYLRCAAIEALSELKNSNESAIVEALLSALRDESVGVRCAAASALGTLKNPNEAVIEALLSALQDEDEYVRCAAAKALGKLKNPSEAIIKVLLSGLQNESIGVRSDIVEVLGELNNSSTAVVEALVNALRDENGYVRSAAAYALGNLNNPSKVVIEALLAALQDEDKYLRRSAAKALDKLKNSSEAAIEALLRALRDEDEEVRRDAAFALGKLKDPSEAIIEALLSALQDNGSHASRAAVQALLGPKTIPAITLIFRQLIKNEKESLVYFSHWFWKNYLLLLDHGKGNVIARQGRQHYHISLPLNDLICLEKQIIAAVGYDDSNYIYQKKSALQSCKQEALDCVVSNAIWLVHLVRKKGGERAFLIVEGVDSEKHLVLRYELSLTQPYQNSSSHFFLPGNGIGRVVKTENFLGELAQDKKSYHCKSWDIDPETGQRLLGSLETDIGEPIPYGMLDGNFSGAVSASFSRTSRHDCLTWAEAKLKAIGLPVEGRWTDFVIVLPAVVAEQGGIAADSACEADPEPVMAEGRDGKTEIPFATVPAHHAEEMAEKMTQRGLFVTAVPKQQIAQSEVGLTELEKSPKNC